MVPRGTVARGGTTLNVKKLGAFGTGKMSDLHALRGVMEIIADGRSAATVFFPPGEYFLGAADEAALLVGRRLENVRFVGDRATVSCRSVFGQSSMFYLQGCRNISLEGLTFRDYGLKREIDWLGAAAIRLANDRRTGCEVIKISDCRFDSVLGAVACRNSNDPWRCRDISLANLSVTRSYYGFSFHDNGDNVTGRGLRCEDVKRSYFPYGISNHDIEIEALSNATGYADCLIKSYQFDTTGIRLKVKSRGKRGGDAIIALDHQHARGNGAIRKVAIDMDIDDADCRLEAAVMMRSLDANTRVERQTTHRWDEIALDGDIRICDQTKLIHVGTPGRVPGRLQIGPRLARHPRLPARLPGFIVRS